MKTEHIIRDWLANNPTFIQSGLKLIKKEHYLQDDIGANGYIDILCKDVYNNFVIIEIKKSDATSREAFTEVFKYAELIRVKYKARPSEIQIIIISTHWGQLIRAFSYEQFKSPFSVKGYQIYLDDLSKIPIRIEEVKSISSDQLPRKFMHYQMLYLFKTKENRIKGLLELKKKTEKTSVQDFVLINVDAPAENKRIIYPFAINVAFQKLTTQELLAGINDLDGNEYLGMSEKDFESIEEFQNYVENAFLAALQMGRYCDDVEIGYPEKFEGMIAGKWQITAIDRSGIFYSDPRYDDELLIKELKGHDGNNTNKFIGFGESDQPERIKEIASECQHCLIHTPTWAEFIDFIICQQINSLERYKLLIDIYNPSSVVNAFYFTLIKKDPLYLPLFQMFIDYPDSSKLEIYVGELKSFGKRPSLKIFTSSNYNEVTDEMFRLKLIPDNEMYAFKMGLSYVVSKRIIIGEKEVPAEFVRLEDNEVISDEARYESLDEYIFKNKTSISQMVNNYGSVYYSPE